MFGDSPAVPLTFRLTINCKSGSMDIIESKRLGRLWVTDDVNSHPWAPFKFRPLGPQADPVIVCVLCS
jgi:hypothetical protein